MSKTIPDASGAVSISGFEEMVSSYKMAAQYLAHLAGQLEAQKLAFRGAAEKALTEAADGTTRVEFSDGKGGCVMVSPPDIEAAAARRVLQTTLLQAAAEAGMDLEGKIEERTRVSAEGATAKMLEQLNGQQCLILTGELVGWLTQVFASQGQPLPESVIDTVPEVSVTTERRLTPAGARELRETYRQLLLQGDEAVEGKMKDAILRLAAAGLKAAAVNTR